MDTIKDRNISGGLKMRKIFNKFHRTNYGFTLVELLIVVAILGVLAAVVLPNVIGLADEGQVEAAKAELVTIQTAMDIMMAKNHITSVTPSGPSSNMSSFPTGNGLYPSYLRTATTVGTYSCDATGLVTQNDDGY